jgi:hypothetical protein
MIKKYPEEYDDMWGKIYKELVKEIDELMTEENIETWFDSKELGII